MFCNSWHVWKSGLLGVGYSSGLSSWLITPRESKWYVLITCGCKVSVSRTVSLLEVLPGVLKRHVAKSVAARLKSPSLRNSTWWTFLLIFCSSVISSFSFGNWNSRDFLNTKLVGVNSHTPRPYCSWLTCLTKKLCPFLFQKTHIITHFPPEYQLSIKCGPHNYGCAVISTN